MIGSNSQVPQSVNLRNIIQEIYVDSVGSHQYFLVHIRRVNNEFLTKRAQLLKVSVTGLLLILTWTAPLEV